MPASRREFLQSIACAGAGMLAGAARSAAVGQGAGDGQAERPRVIDVHSHYWAPAYLDALRASGDIPITTDANGTVRIHYPGNVSTVVRGHSDLDFRAQLLDEHGIDLQVLSFSNPGTQVQPPPAAVAGARMFNDALAAAVAERPSRFAALGTLPLNDPGASARELERVVAELGMRGALILSNVDGVPLSDARFWPLYETADALGAVMFIHPTYPAATTGMTEYRLTALLGFLNDTTLAAASLVYGGVVERFPRIRWVLANLGGTIPFVAERLDRGYEAFEDNRVNITRPPSEYLRGFYYDTVNFDPRALRLAAEFAGFDHLLAGSDYPANIGSPRRMLDSIEAMGAADRDTRAVLGGNAARLLGL